MKVSAVIVTRGNVDLGPVLLRIHADEIIIRRGHGGVWERFEAARSARHEVVYTQDDDAVVEMSAVIAAYDRGSVTCNMPADRRREYPDGIALVGWGAVFHQAAVDVFDEYLAAWPFDELVRREADRVFTGLNRVKLIDVPFTHLPWAEGADRMGREARHGDDLREIRKRIQAVSERG